MITAISTLGGMGSVAIFVSFIFLLMRSLNDSGNDSGLISYILYLLFAMIASVFFIPVYILAIVNGGGVATVLVGAFAMLVPVYLTISYFFQLFILPLTILGPGLQIALFVLALN